VEVCDHLADVRVASSSWRLVAHLLSDPLHRAGRGPAVQEVNLLPVALPDRSAQTLAEVTAEEVEALLSIVELDSPRLVGMELETESREVLPHVPLCLLALLLRLAHHGEIVGVAHQRAHVGTMSTPQQVENVQVDVRQER